MTRFLLAGPGRAAHALGLALHAAGHRAAGVTARRSDAAATVAAALDAPSVPWEGQLPPADLMIIGVSDDAIGAVAAHLASRSKQVAAAVHLSGLVGVGVLAPLAAAGLRTGSFHPLQTLPDPTIGAARLAGAWVAVSSDDGALRAVLHDLAGSIGTHPFDLADQAKPLYHAGAAAAANYPLLALSMAEGLLAAAGVPFAAARPLVEAVVANAFELGPRRALTGPVARGDVETVRAQLAAVAAEVPEWRDAFGSLAEALARLTGREAEFRAVLP